MSRTGTRSYECVRRAWHSDRHHPIRGSLIQEIFRIVNELHSSATRRNREWQEKLPIVVLKAEEIMYSKANSEAEYLDLKTLWDRVNDAINTIIRRDQSTETGELLLPCIEAALHLGCTPRRSSRSQRNDPPRYYLSPETPEAISDPSSKSLHSFLKADNHSIQNRNYNDKKFPVLLKNFAPSNNHHASAQTLASSKTWSVYPLHYTNQIQPDDPKFYTTRPSNSYSHLMESDEIGVPRNLHPCKLDASDFIFPSDCEHNLDRGHGIKCDLTLRLGSLMVPCANFENCWPLEVENGNSSTSIERRTFKSCLNK